MAAKTWSKEKPEFTNAGNYEVAVKVTNPVYENREGNAKITIEQKEITITVADAQKAYGESDPTFDGTVKGLVGADDLGLTYSRTNDVENAGTYPGVITAEITNANYKLTVVPGDFVITQAKSDKELVGENYSGEYQGTPHKPAILDEGSLEEGDQVYYSVNGGEPTTVKPEFTDAGDYEVKITVKNPNYADREATITVTITPKEVTVTVENASKTYGTPDPAFSGAVAGLIDGDDLGLTYTRTNDAENVGTYPGVLSAEITNPNYSLKVEKGDFAISKAKSDHDMPVKDYSGEYKGTPH